MVSVKFVFLLLIAFCVASTLAMQVSGRSSAFQHALRHGAESAEMMEFQAETEIDQELEVVHDAPAKPLPELKVFTKFETTARKAQAGLKIAEKRLQNTMKDLSKAVATGPSDKVKRSRTAAVAARGMLAFSRTMAASEAYHANLAQALLSSAQRRSVLSNIPVTKAPTMGLAERKAYIKMQNMGLAFAETDASVQPSKREVLLSKLELAEANVDKATDGFQQALMSMKSMDAKSFYKVRTASKVAADNLYKANLNYNQVLAQIETDDIDRTQ